MIAAPISKMRMHPAAVGRTDKYDHVRNPVRKIVDDFASPVAFPPASATIPSSMLHQSRRNKKRRDHEQNRISASLPERERGESGECDRRIGNQVRWNPNADTMRSRARAVRRKISAIGRRESGS